MSLSLDLHRLITADNAKKAIHYGDRISSTSDTPTSVGSDQSSGKM
jgi:hypothetical protein